MALRLQAPLPELVDFLGTPLSVFSQPGSAWLMARPLSVHRWCGKRKTCTAIRPFSTARLMMIDAFSATSSSVRPDGLLSRSSSAFFSASSACCCRSAADALSASACGALAAGTARPAENVAHRLDHFGNVQELFPTRWTCEGKTLAVVGNVFPSGRRCGCPSGAVRCPEPNRRAASSSGRKQSRRHRSRRSQGCMDSSRPPIVGVLPSRSVRWRMAGRAVPAAGAPLGPEQSSHREASWSPSLTHEWSTETEHNIAQGIQVESCETIDRARGAIAAEMEAGAAVRWTACRAASVSRLP